MKHYQCENCGAELIKNGDEYVCEYCRRTYADDSLEKAYYKVCQTLQTTVQGVVSEEFLRSKIEKIATCRQGLYKARTGEYIDNDDIHDWAKSILKLLPDDPQANFYEIASTERWSDLNKFLSKFDVKENGYLLDGFVDYLTNGRFVEKCVLRLNDLISRAFPENSDEYKSCHKKIVEATEKHNAGTFDPTLPRDVFVAYSSKDSEKAYEMVEYLEERGLNCFISMRNLPKGVDAEKYYEKRLKQAIDNCQVFLFVSSKNSRSRSCDAYSLEISYVKECDLRASGNANYYNANYDLYLEKSREKCKPRVEWLIENYGNSIYETEVKKFFKGLSWCVDEESVLSSVADYITNSPIVAEEKKSDEFARQKEEFEKQKAEFERQRAELEKLKTERERQNAENLARQQAEIERQRAESERQQLEFEKQKMEIERQKLEFEKQRIEIERQKAALSQAKPVETPVVPSAPPVKGITLHNELYDIDDGVLTRYKGSQMFTDVPEGTHTIESYAFNGNDTLYTISLPDSLRTIKSRAITNCKTLVSVGIPKFVEKIESNAICAVRNNFTAFAEPTSKPIGWDSDWAKCPEIKWGAKVNVGKRKAEQPVEKPVEPTPPPVQKTVKGITLNNAEFDIKDGVLRKYKGSEWIIFVPEGTLEIASYAFSNQEFYTVSLPPTARAVRKHAFHNCSRMVSVELPSSVTEIEEDAFYGCSPKFGVYAQATETPKGWKYGWNNGCATVKMGAKVSHPYGATPTAQASKQQEKPAVTTKPKTTPTAKPKTPTPVEKPTAKTPVVVNGFEIENGVLKKYRGSEKEVVIPDTVKEIGERAFADCKNITSIKIPDGVKTIGMQAFAGCENLGDVVIPASVTDIGGNAFMYCTKSNLFTPLKEKPQGWKIGTKPVVWSYGTTEEKSIEKPKENSAASQEFRIKDGVLKKYKGDSGDVVIPDGVVMIDTEAFKNVTSLKSVKVPSSVTCISNFAFSDCSELQSVELPSSLNSIGHSVFSHCIQLKSIIIPPSVKNVQSSAFANCYSLTSVTLSPNSDLSLAVFSGCNSLKEIKIPSGVTRIHDKAFANCTNLEKIFIPSSVTFIFWGAFSNSPKVKIYTDLKEKPPRWDIRNIPVVWGYNETEEKFAKKQEFFEKQAAAWNNSLKKTETKPVEIKQPSFNPNGLESSVKNANKSLAQAKKDLANAKAKLAENPDFEIKNGELVKYKGKEEVVVVPKEIIRIGKEAFLNCNFLKEVRIISATTIGLGAFKGCTKLRVVQLPNTLKTICSYAFEGTDLSTITIPNGVTSIGWGAFRMSNLFSISFSGGASLKKIEGCAFEGCSHLSTIELPYGLTVLAYNTFSDCTNLIRVNLPYGLTKIEKLAFNNCKKLSSIFIHTKVDAIDVHAFANCSSLTVYAETKKKPKGWVQPLFGKESWNPDRRPVKWGLSYSAYLVRDI